MLHLDESSLDRTVRVPVGQVIELRLNENPTTGFRWSFAADGAPVCSVVADKFERTADRPGAGGEHAWQIEAVRAGTCHLRLVYRRPFGPAAPPARTFALDVEVSK
jgi:inhibitor of cysteine peptidase